MKNLNRLLSFILCLQLIGCNSASQAPVAVKTKNAPVPTVESQEVEINGSIAYGLKFLSEIFLASAVAAEGTLSLYDVSSIDNPQLLDSQDISGTDEFSFKLKKEMVNEKFLKVSFESKEGDDKSRIFLLVPDGSPKLTVDLNQEVHLKHQLIETLIRQQNSQERLELSGMKDLLINLQSSEEEKIYYILGSKELMLKLLGDRDLAPAVHEILSLIKAEESLERQWDYRMKLIDLAQRFSDRTQLNCHGTELSLLIRDGQGMNMRFSPLDEEIMKEFGSDIDLGTVNDYWSANRSLLEIAHKFKTFGEERDQSLRGKLSIYNNQKELVTSCYIFNREIEDLSADLRILSEFSFSDFNNPEDAKAHLEEAFERSIAELIHKLASHNIQQGSPAFELVFNQEVVLIKRLYEKRYEEFYSMKSWQ